MPRSAARSSGSSVRWLDRPKGRRAAQGQRDQVIAEMLSSTADLISAIQTSGVPSDAQLPGGWLRTAIAAFDGDWRLGQDKDSPARPATRRRPGYAPRGRHSLEGPGQARLTEGSQPAHATLRGRYRAVLRRLPLVTNDGVISCLERAAALVRRHRFFRGTRLCTRQLTLAGHRVAAGPASDSSRGNRLLRCQHRRRHGTMAHNVARRQFRGSSLAWRPLQPCHPWLGPSPSPHC